VTFAVDLTALAGVPAMLHRLADDAAACREHVGEQYDRLDGPIPLRDTNGGAGLINRIAGNHSRIRREVLGFFDGVRSSADRRGDAVAEAVASYVSVDQRTAAALDALLAPTPPDPAAGRARSLQPQWEQVRATEQLHPTQSLRPVADLRASRPYQPAWGDVFSPTSLARDAVWHLTGLAARIGLCDHAHDPMDDLVIPFVGDWAGMRACGEALGHLADATRALAANAGWIAIRVEGAWLGNAADACWDRLRRLERPITQAPRVLAQMSAAYLDVCDKIQSAEELAEFAVTELLDWAAAALLAAETGGLSLMVKGLDHLADLRGLVRTFDKALGIVDGARLAVEHGDSILAGLGLLDVDDGLVLPAVPA
jgi:hypothetical protein